MKKWIPFAAGAAVVLAAFALALIFGLFGSAQPLPQAVLYLDGEDVYLASGEQTLLLADAAVETKEGAGTLRGEFSPDNRYLYYLADVPEGETAGTLMIADIKAMTTASIAEGVYLAKAGADRVLYFREGQAGMVGALYSAEIGSEPEKIANGVLQYFYGFSKNGSSIYYTVQSDLPSGSSAASGGHHYALYIKTGGNPAVKRFEVDAGGTNILSTLFKQIILGNDGELLFSRLGGSDEGKEGQYILTLNAKGSVDSISVGGTVVQTFKTPEDFLYAEGAALYYKAPGEAKVRLSQNYDTALFPPYYGAAKDYTPGKRFLLLERKTSEGTAEDKVTLYEQTLGKDKVKIISADPESPVINVQFSAVAFKDSGRLYLMVKKSGKWGDRVSLCDNTKGYIFDRSGKYLYYIETNSADAAYGDLMRCRVSDGKIELLQYDVTGLNQTGAGLFTRVSDGALYWLDGKGKQQELPEGSLAAREASGGYYAAVQSDAYDLIYIKQGVKEGKTLCYNASALVTPGGFAVVVNVEIPDPDKSGQDQDDLTPETLFSSIGLNEEQSGALAAILADLLYYSDQYCDTDYSTAATPPLGYETALNFIDYLLGLPDCSKETQNMAESSQLAYDMIEAYEEGGEAIYLSTIKSNIKFALTVFQMYTGM